MKGWDTSWIIITVCGLCGSILSGFSYLWYFFIERAIWTSTLKELMRKPSQGPPTYNTPAVVYPQYSNQQILNGWMAPSAPSAQQLNPQNLY